jgi:integrase
VSSVKKRPDGSWRARYRDIAGREHAKHFPRKADADRWVTTQMAAVHRGEHVDPHDKTTVAEYSRAWAAARPHRPTTARRVSLMIEKHIAATNLGDRRMASVRPSEVQAWATGRSEVLAASTLRLLVGLLRSIYASAVLDRIVGSSPVIRLSLPAATHERVVPLSVEQVRSLAVAMPERCAAMVVTQAGLGLRINELLALRAQDVDFLRRTARVEHQLGGRDRLRVAPKTPRSRRTLPLPQVVAEVLAEHMRRFPQGPDGLLFTSKSGKPYQADYYGVRVFRTAVADASLPAGTTSHDLRHHYASVLLAAGESVIAIAERLGHENANLVLSTYGHLMPDSEDRTRRAVDEAWSATAEVAQGGQSQQFPQKASAAADS